MLRNGSKRAVFRIKHQQSDKISRNAFLKKQLKCISHAEMAVNPFVDVRLFCGIGASRTVEDRPIDIHG
ncbi:unnamed protein product [Acanthoscelides obtectus]|uniref:Uncharacterized protein n=1 Tax=Acanthoscelides obtectus TaxID=200917 RepID=A0A9P0KE56_ACAOB|nr:unnamed protein product [Acanthoscelides obtectus]CAK1646974.1 hypothetical protein AOBTE_LOCUS14978 [Acanthoscelides obtectus]